MLHAVTRMFTPKNIAAKQTNHQKLCMYAAHMALVRV